MSKCLSAAVAAILALATGACQQPTAQQMNTTNANSPIHIGALTCSVSGGSGYLFGSTKDLSCGYTKAGHMIWHVYQLAGLVGNKTSSDPRFIAGNYGGEQASIAAGSSAGGNWLYGGSNNQVVLQATQLQDSTNAGYNLAYGIAEMSLTPRN